MHSRTIIVSMSVFMIHLLFMNRESKAFCVPACQRIARKLCTDRIVNFMLNQWSPTAVTERGVYFALPSRVALYRFFPSP
jgi:hypothetical protein